MDYLNHIFEYDLALEEPSVKLDDLESEPPPVPKGRAVDPAKEHLYKEYKRKPDQCDFHSYEKVGENFLGEAWWNCRYCGVARERVWTEKGISR